MSRQAVSSSAGRIITGLSSHSLPAALKNAAVPAQVYCRATWFGGHEATLTQLLRQVHTHTRTVRVARFHETGALLPRRTPTRTSCFDVGCHGK